MSTSKTGKNWSSPGWRQVVHESPEERQARKKKRADDIASGRSKQTYKEKAIEDSMKRTPADKKRQREKNQEHLEKMKGERYKRKKPTIPQSLPPR